MPPAPESATSSSPPELNMWSPRSSPRSSPYSDSRSVSPSQSDGLTDSDAYGDLECEMGSEPSSEELSGSDYMEEDYSPRATSKTQQASTSSRSNRVSPSARHASSSPSCSTPVLSSTAARMKQVDFDFVPLPGSAIKAKKCPICARKFTSGRVSDLRRHYEGHYQARTARHCCNGISIANAEKFGFTDTSDAVEFEGEMRVGRFCGKRFSRRDAFLRHIKDAMESDSKDQLPCDTDKPLSKALPRK